MDVMMTGGQDLPPPRHSTDLQHLRRSHTIPGEIYVDNHVDSHIYSYAALARQ